MRKRVKASLVCERCAERNYRIRASRPGEERLRLRKYCARCGCHTVHREVR